ncbi:MAG: tRNA (N6-isopentenyl adenosine(37)-C2)-methylthiotransferase MiaB [Deltaproteobacteria bacterium]|nr:tRNA (N6-isopentenyl adenosine(37)-C2)-methylthiotransferase MiaB [Deltaproteobacteria bacterium]
MDQLNGGAPRMVYLETFGCQMNELDSSRMIGALAEIGFRRTDNPGAAEVILINTCAVRDKAEHKLYSMLGRFRELKRERPGLVIGVAGCVAQRDSAALLKRAPYVDIVFGTHNVHRLKDFLDKAATDAGVVVETAFRDALEPEEYAFNEVAADARAFVAIMRGCNNFCAYCIVPYTRGRELSRRSADIIAEIERLARSGAAEVTLVGQNVNSYGANSGGDCSFPELLRKASMTAGIKRVRFMTSHPKDISDELIDAFSEAPNLCRHMHLPVQSGSDGILKKMRRGYTRDEYAAKARRIRSLYPDMSITSDIIVGFPGEGDKDFEDTLGLISDLRFDNIFSFMYSPRPGTEAAAFKDHVPAEVKAERLRLLQEAQRGITIARNGALVGTMQEVMIEGDSKTNARMTSGRTRCGRIVNFPAPDGYREALGATIRVMITGAYANSLAGEFAGQGQGRTPGQPALLNGLAWAAAAQQRDGLSNR